MASHEQGVLNPVEIDVAKALSNFGAYTTALRLTSPVRVPYDEMSDGRRQATEYGVRMQKPHPIIGSYSSRIPLAFFWGDSEQQSRRRAIQINELQNTIRAYQGQTALHFVEGSPDDISDFRHRPPDFKINVVQITPPRTGRANREKKGGAPEPEGRLVHALPQLLPAAARPASYADVPIATFKSGFPILSQQTIRRSGGKVSVGEMIEKPSHLIALSGIASLDPSRELYEKLRRERRATLLFGNQGAFQTLELLAKMTGGDFYRNFSTAADNQLIRPRKSLPDLSFLNAQPRPEAPTALDDSLMANIDDLLAQFPSKT